jgi:hypothetical protein
MTRQRDFKALVRERMAKTGERYTAARAQLLSKPTDTEARPSYPGVLDRYTQFGGVQSGQDRLRTCCASRASPLHSRASRTRKMINGLCGGPGFLYAVFEYKGLGPILSIALQSRSMPDVYLDAGLNRLGLRLETFESSSAIAARKTLDETLGAGSAPICVTDAASLPWSGLPKENRRRTAWSRSWAATKTTTGSTIAPTPRRAQRLLTAARGAYRKAKNRLIRVDSADHADARRRPARRDRGHGEVVVEPAVPKSFWVNCGFSGLDKWRAMLTDRKDKPGRRCSPAARAFGSLPRMKSTSSRRQARARVLRRFRTTPRRARASAIETRCGGIAGPGVAWIALVDTIANCSDRALQDALEITGQRLEITDRLTRPIRKEH